jgi:UDP-glucose 4-epimerase
VAAESDATGVFNIGTWCRSNINQVADTIKTAMVKELEPIHQEPRAGDVIDSLASILKAKAIRYQPGYNLERGL